MKYSLLNKYVQNLRVNNIVLCVISRPEDRQEMAGSSCGQNKIKKNVESWKNKLQTQKHSSQPKARERLTIPVMQKTSKVNAIIMTESEHMQFQQKTTHMTSMSEMPGSHGHRCTCEYCGENIVTSKPTGFSSWRQC